MWNITTLKTRGREAFKLNYWMCVVAAFLISVIAMGSSGAAGNSVRSSQEVTVATQDLTNAVNALSPQEKAAVAGAIGGGLFIIAVIGILLRIFVSNPLQVGCHRFFQKNVYDSTTKLGIIGEGFGDYVRTFITMLLRDLLIVFFALLFIVPGIIKAYEYRMVPYLLKDNPELGPNEVLRRSRELMAGNKMQAFKMDLSFIGWFLLGAITFNLVNVFWTNPYYQSTNAALYLELTGQNA